MDELGDLRMQKKDELRKQLAEQQLRKQQEFEAEQKLNEITNAVLTDSARNRLNNVKLVNKGLYLNTLQYIILLYRSGRVSGKIDEPYLLSLLKKFSQTKEIKITRK